MAFTLSIKYCARKTDIEIADNMKQNEYSLSACGDIVYLNDALYYLDTRPFVSGLRCVKNGLDIFVCDCNIFNSFIYTKNDRLYLRENGFLVDETYEIDLIASKKRSITNSRSPKDIEAKSLPNTFNDSWHVPQNFPSTSSTTGFYFNTYDDRTYMSCVNLYHVVETVGWSYVSPFQDLNTVGVWEIDSNTGEFHRVSNVAMQEFAMFNTSAIYYVQNGHLRMAKLTE